MCLGTAEILGGTAGLCPRQEMAWKEPSVGRQGERELAGCVWWGIDNDGDNDGVTVGSWWGPLTRHS